MRRMGTTLFLFLRNRYVGPKHVFTRRRQEGIISTSLRWLLAEGGAWVLVSFNSCKAVGSARGFRAESRKHVF